MKFKVYRTDLINYLISKYNLKNYLEIGVRNPDSNFNKIKILNKIAVDPEPIVKQNNIYVGTSDKFFSQLNDYVQYDIIFIDGLHLEYQVDKDIENSLRFLKKDGFILLHDCNPPTEFHQRQNYEVNGTYPPWNGTTWRSIAKLRMFRNDLKINVVDTDWGVGIITKSKHETLFKRDEIQYSLLESNRVELLNLISVDNFKSIY